MYWYWQKIIPLKFHKNSGLIEYSFQVSNPWAFEFNYISNSRGNVKKIPSSAYCEIFLYNKRYYLLIPKTKDAQLFQSIMLLGKTFFSGDRLHRYLNAYKAYECLSESPDPTLKAIRNGLSHPSTTLTNKTTKKNLIDIFGSTSIDIAKFKHQRILFTHLGRLLIEIDQLAFKRIKLGLNNYYHLKSSQDVVYDWQIKALKKV